MKIHNTTNQATFDVEADTVLGLKRAIHAEISIPPNNQKLSFRGHTLRNNQSLSHYQIGNDDTVDLEYSLKGGCFDCDGVECCCLPCCVM